MQLHPWPTPLAGTGSLLTSSFSESPSNHYSETYTTIKHSPAINHYNKLSFHQAPGGCHNFTSVSSNSSPISPSINDKRGFRRAQSDGNLEGLAYASCNSTDEFHYSSQTQKFSSGRPPKCSMLQTIPSFSFYGSKGWCEDNEDEDSDWESLQRESQFVDDEVERSTQGKEKFMSMGGSELNKKNVGFVAEKGFGFGSGNVGYEEKRESVSSEMYLARELDLSGCGFGGGGDFNPANSGRGGDDGDRPGVEGYYRKMVEENPGNPLFLRNYAQYLYQTKQDLHGAEEYYSRAILADPEDGEILSQYAKLTWELHSDQERASNYFERAVQAAPEDCHVHAAYASFLWETEEDEEKDNPERQVDAVSPLFYGQAVASTSG